MPITISNQKNLSSATASVKNGTANSVMIFNIPVMKKEQNVLYNQISLINAQIPVSYYIINDTNNKFVIGTGSYTLTSGNYNATSFKSMFFTLLGASYSMTIDNTTGKYTLSKTGGYTILSTTTCWKILGLQKSVTYITSGSLTFPFPANFLE